MFYIILAAASLVSRNIRRDMKLKVQKNNLKPYNDLFIKIKQSKTTLGPIRSFTLKENHIGSAVRFFASYTITDRQKQTYTHLVTIIRSSQKRKLVTLYLDITTIRGINYAHDDV